jgi:penicillin-binding protein 1A
MMARKTKKPPHHWLHRVVYWLALGSFLICLAGFAGAWIGYDQFGRDLPLIDSLHDFRPPIPTQVFADDGTLIAEFGEQRRRVLTDEQIPQLVKQTFLAAEDHRFLEHRGVDFHGVLGALWWDVRHPGEIHGASTITMQVARTFFLSREKTMSRKIKEAILALRIERDLTKPEILTLYLNQVDMGRGCYGLGAASEYYFNKPASELTQGEAALLAGLLPAPSRYNPVASFRSARQRQRVVLFDKMVQQAGVLSVAEAEAAYEGPLSIVGHLPPQGEDAPYFTEQVRRLLLERYGEDMLYRQGLKVFTTVNVHADRTAREALEKRVLGPDGLDQGIGYRGPLTGAPLSGDSAQAFLDHAESQFRNNWANDQRREALAQGTADQDGLSFDEIMARAPDPAPLTPGERYKAVVLAVSDAPAEVQAGIGHSRGSIKKEDMAWAGRYDEKISPPARLGKPTALFQRGDVILARVVEAIPGQPGSYRLALEQEPVIQGGLISMSTRDGHVKALAGGVDYKSSQFIRPLQATRQPGSAFKPVIYAAALDDPRGRYTPATTIVDTAMVFDKDAANPSCPNEVRIWEAYKPRNYSGSFSGTTTLRNAVAHSINTVAARIAWDLCLPSVIDYAKTLGIKSQLDMLPCLALGCSEVTLVELTSAYNVFATGGYLVAPVYITRVYDRDGNLLEYEEEWDGHTVIDGETTNAIDPAEFIDRDAVRTKHRGEPRRYQLDLPSRPADLGQLPWPEYLDRIKAADHPRIAPLAQPINGARAISPQTAYLMNSLLGSVIKYGTAGRAAKLGRPLAGKTGTTNNYKDALFIGYSPEVITGVWVGPDDFAFTLGRGMSGGKAALPIWIDFMQEILKDRGRVDFPLPDGLEWVSIDPATGLRASPCSKTVISEVFKQGSAPIEDSQCDTQGSEYIQNFDRDLNQ